MGDICVLIVLFISIYSVKWELFNSRYVLFGIYMLLLLPIGFSYGLPDYSMYERFFYGAVNFDFRNIFGGYEIAIDSEYSRDFGYTVLSYLFNNLGFHFIEYRFFLYALGLLIIFFIACKKCKNPILVISLYMLYPYVMDAIQLRNYMLECVLFVAFFVYSIQYNAIIKRSVIWISLILLAATFHSSALLLLCFFIFDIALDTKFKYIVYCFIGVGVLMPLYADYIQSNYMLIKLLFTNMDSSLRHYAFYTEKTVIRKHLTCYLFLISLYIYMHFLIYIQAKTHQLGMFFNKNYILKAKRFIMYNFCFAPLYPIFSDLAIRFPRNCLLIIYMSTVLVIDNSPYRVKILLLVITSILALTMGRLDLYAPVLIDNVDLFMNNNYLFDL